MKKPKVLVTGATGFIGSQLVKTLLTDTIYHPIAVIRTETGHFPIGIETIQVVDLLSNMDLLKEIKDIQSIIHLAGRAHVLNETITNPLVEFRRVNVETTLLFAQQAAATGVKRFIFISSIKVNGEMTSPGSPFKADDSPNPLDSYAISKYEAEEGLKKIAAETGMEVVIIRPPLVYGLGVKANFLNMIRWVKKGIPLPLGSIHNKRTLVALDNLVDLIITCIDQPAAMNQTFLAGDAEDVSTTELLKKIGQTLGKPARLIPTPPFLLKAGASLVGKPGIAQKLCSNLQVDISKAWDLLGWEPPFTLDEGIYKAIKN